MIELTEQQMQALGNADAVPARIVNPRTNETFVLLPIDEYEHLKLDEYDDSPWTSAELQALAWEAGRPTGWDDMDEYESGPRGKKRPVVVVLDHSGEWQNYWKLPKVA